MQIHHFCDPYCFQSKNSHQTGEGMIEQNIHYHSFWKWSFENSVKNYKHIKSNPQQLFYMQYISETTNDALSHPFPRVFYVFIPVAHCSKDLL